MKKISIIAFAISLVLLLTINLMADKNSKKVRFEFYLNRHLSTSFDPDSMNRVFNPADSYDNAALYLIDDMLLRGSGWDALDSRICLSTDMPTAKGKVLSKTFIYGPGDAFALAQERNFTVSRSGIPFQVGIDIPLSEIWSVDINYIQSEKYRFEQFESQDYFTIETLQKLPGTEVGYSWWEMDLQRTYERSVSTSSFRSMGFEVAVRYILLGSSNNIGLYPEAGVSFNAIKRKFDQGIEFYGYSPTLFPGIVFPGSSPDDYRDLRDSEDLRGDSTSKLKTRFFAGLNLHFSPIHILGLSCTARIYDKKLHQEYPTTSVLGDFAFGLDVSQFFFSVGITLSFLN